MEVIASKHYTPEDVKIYLKRKVKNCGLLNKRLFPDNAFTSLAVNDTYAFFGGWFYSLGTYKNIFIGRKHDLTASIEGSFDRDILPAAFTQSTAGAAFYDNEVVLSYASTDKVYKYLDVGGTGTNAEWERQVGTGLDEPSGLAFNRGGQLFVCDKAHHRIMWYDYGVLLTFASLTSATYMAVDLGGNIYVASGTDNVVYVYDYTLAVVTNFTIGDAAYHVTGLAVDNKLYVAKGAEGTYSCETDGSASTLLLPLINGKKMTVDDNYIYVPGTNSYVSRYDKSTGVLVDGLYLEGTNTETTHCLRIYDGYMYALMPVLGKVLKVPVDDFIIANVTTVVTGITTNHGTFFDTDTKGFMYITDTTDHVILKYASDGLFISSWGSGDLNAPKSIRFNSLSNQIIICDSGNNKIINYYYGLYKGKMEKSGGGAGTGHGEFTSPYSITFDGDGEYFYVADNLRIQRFQFDRTWNAEWVTAGTGPIAFSSTEDRVYISAGKFAYVYDVDGNNPRYFTFIDFTTTVLYMVSREGYLYVAGTDGIYRYEITPDFEDTWTDVTKYIIKDLLKITETTDESDFSLGKITLGNIDFVVNNTDDKWDFENNMNSIFYSVEDLYQRNQSVLKIVLDDVELARGLIDGKNITNEENLLKFKAYSPFKYMETILSNNIKPALTDGDNISDIIPKIINNRFFENIIEYNVSDIDIYNDVVIDDVSELPNTTLDMLILLAKLGFFKFGLYLGYKFFINNAIDLCQAGTIDYLITQNNLLGVESYNNGEQRLFKKVNITYTGGSTYFELPDAAQVSFNEEREVDIQADCLTSLSTAQAVAAAYAYVTSWPSKEIEVRLPFLNYGLNLYAKTFGFNIFDDTRGLKFNSPSLNADTAALPDKNTAMDDSGRIIYYPLNIEHRIGKEMCTIIKLKEFIDDAI